MSPDEVRGIAARSVFDRIVCGIDTTPESLEAVRQAGLLRAAAGSIALVTVVDLNVAVHAGFQAGHAAVELEGEARLALKHAHDEAREATYRLLTGRPLGSLLEEVTRERATLVAVGTHNRPRAVGIALGTVGTGLLHDAPCSVLLSRPPLAYPLFPRSIVVGVDGSSESLVANAVASDLEERFGATVSRVVAQGGKPVNIEGLRVIDGLQWDERKPVDALVAASRDADLLVLGSRGLHGISALGSVSERVAHRAGCSVLVTRASLGE